MVKNTFSGRFCLIAFMGLLVIVPSTEAFARDRGARREVVVVGRDRYHYRDGRFYRPGWFGFEFRIGAPPVGAVVMSLPFGHTTITVGGTPYYYYDRVYYRHCPSGYMVVTEPVVVQPQTIYGNTVTINVPNSRGGYTPITLVRSGNGYVGPQGEYYPGNPSVEQLIALYGR